MTCVYVILRKGEQIDRKYLIEETKVEFGQIPETSIQKYPDHENPYNKAGGYGIQGIAMSMIKGIEGCVANVIGFPLNAFSNMLIEMLN